MLACIPTNGKSGRDDTICEHFGSAPYFTIYDSATREVLVVENRNSHHSHGSCHPMNQLAEYHIDAVVCAGMGRRAIEALNTEGVRIVDAGTTSVAEAMDKINADELIDVDPARACRGRGQKAGFGHGPAHPDLQDGRGRGTGRGPGITRGTGRGTGRGQGRGRQRGRVR